MDGKNYRNIDEYLANFNGETRQNPNLMRKILQESAPEAKEKIAYGIPTLTLRGNLVHFAGYKNHIGFYPGAMPISELKDKLKGYKTSKGTVQFPVDKPLPRDLIDQITRLCVQRNHAKK